MSADRLHFHAPTTHPVTMLSNSGNPGNMATIGLLREATIWGKPQISPPPGGLWSGG